MDRYINDKGEEVIIAEMDGNRLINAIAKYARKEAVELDDAGKPAPEATELVKALKAEAVRRLA